MSPVRELEADVVIAGAGLAGMVTAYEALGRGRRIVVLDKDKRENCGGLAAQAFGGLLLIDTPYQRRLGIKDSPNLAWRDWQSVADYQECDHWPRQWARFYCEHSRDFIFEFLGGQGITYLPLVSWAERGTYGPGNSVPRFHIVWGTGHEIVHRMLHALEKHPNRSRLQFVFDTEVSDIEFTNGRVAGVRARSMGSAGELRVRADQVVIATGGICGGDLARLRANWYKPWGDPPTKLLNGAHDYGDGMLHEVVAKRGGAVTHLDLHWHYAAGVHHPAKRRPNDGLSLVPPRSALWFNARGERLMTPGPMPVYGDTRHLVETVLRQPGQYSWQVMNWKIAVRELAVSGCDYMTAYRYKKRLALASSVLFGNRMLVERLISECPEDFIVAQTLDELIERMDRQSLYGNRINRTVMTETIQLWDEMIARGAKFHNDEQLRRIASSYLYRGDRIRLCKFQEILDPKARPLIAIREFILARKSLGGIQTDLECRVLRASDGQPIPGLFAVGEAAGFGGGGIHGKGSLEGTFLGSCVITGRVAGKNLVA